ncbi:hypothetical protein ECP029894211_4970 [Escherichia coli P0298942.11]|nr:hypothetical protein ECP029894211_4970 [Escherichia coli P0298942.11]
MGQVFPLAHARAALIMNSNILLLSLCSLILPGRMFNDSNISCPFRF